jgi:hypothetical protein
MFFPHVSLVLPILFSIRPIRKGNELATIIVTLVTSFNADIFRYLFIRWILS